MLSSVRELLGMRRCGVPPFRDARVNLMKKLYRICTSIICLSGALNLGACSGATDSVNGESVDSISFAASPCRACPAGGNSACLMDPTNGRVLTNPHVYITYWGFNSSNDPSGEIAAVNDMVSHLGGSKYLNVVTEYTNPAGVAAGNPVGLYTANNSATGDLWFDTSTPACRWDANCASTIRCSNTCADLTTWNRNNEDEVQKMVNHFGQQGKTGNIYMIFYPPGSGTPTNYCGFHAWTTLNSDGNSYPYAIMPNADTGCQIAGEAVFHEIAEAIVDPFADGYKISSTSPAHACTELGDIGQEVSFPQVREPVSATASYVQRGFWSQSANTAAGVNTTIGNVYTRSNRYDQYVQNGGNLWHSSGTADGYAPSWSAITQNRPAGVTIAGGYDVAATSSVNDRVDIFAFQDNAHLWHIYWNGSTWSWGEGNNQTAWTTANGGLPAGCTTPYSPDVSSSQPEWLDLALSCFNSNDNKTHLYFRRFRGDTQVWDGWTDLGTSPAAGGTIDSGSTLITWPSSSTSSANLRADIFVHTTSGNLSQYTSTNVNSATPTWTNAGTPKATPTGVTLKGDPDAAAWGLNRIDLVQTDTTGKLQHLAWNGSGWAWDGGGLNGSGAPTNVQFRWGPSIVSEGDGRLWVSAVATSGSPWLISFKTAIWSAWSKDTQGISNNGIESSSW